MKDTLWPTTAVWDWAQASGKRMFGAANVWLQAPALCRRARQVRHGATPSEVVYEEDGLELRHYLGEVRYRTPLVFVYALVNRPYILDLKPGRSVVAHFVEKGFDTYLIDWGVPTDADRHRNLDDYVNGYMMNVLNHVRARTGADNLSVLGYCMGGTLSAIFTALHPAIVKNLILLAAPIDFRTREGLLNLWTRPEYFDVDKFVNAFGNCPAEFLQASFLLLQPVGNLIEKPLNFYEHLDDENFLDDFVATETWLQDNIPVAGEVYREFVKYLYQQNLLVQNRLRVGRKTVDLNRITCPVLNLMAGRDNLVPCAQGQTFNTLVGSSDQHTILLEKSGHIGLAIGGRAQTELWPQATAWLGARSLPTAK